MRSIASPWGFVGLCLVVLMMPPSAAAEEARPSDTFLRASGPALTTLLGETGPALLRWTPERNTAETFAADAPPPPLAPAPQVSGAVFPTGGEWVVSAKFGIGVVPVTNNPYTNVLGAEAEYHVNEYFSAGLDTLLLFGRSSSSGIEVDQLWYLAAMARLHFNVQNSAKSSVSSSASTSSFRLSGRLSSR